MRSKCTPSYAYCIQYKTLASGCLVLKDFNYKQPLTPDAEEECLCILTGTWLPPCVQLHEAEHNIQVILDCEKGAAL